MEIRPTSDEDFEALVALRLAFIAEVRRVAPDGFDPAFLEATRAFAADLVEQGRLHSWFALDDAGRPIGVVSVIVNDAPPLPEVLLRSEGYVVNMYVEPGARSQGVGRALLAAAHAAGPSLGLRRLYLHTTDDGRPLYESLGYRPDARWMGTRLHPS